MLINGHNVYIRKNFTPKTDRAVFFDRDGVINIDKGFTYRLEDLSLIPEAIKAMKRLNEAGIPVIIIHNAAAVARGLCSITQVEAFNRLLIKKIAAKNSFVDAVFYCPHHEAAYNRRFTKNCDWRKPGPGMLMAAAEQFNLQLAKCFVIGDQARDMAAAKAAGAIGFLVMTGQETLANINKILL